MALPDGVRTKTLVFGRYSSVLGNNRGGTVSVGFADAMLYEPTGDVIAAGMETIKIGEDSGVAAVTVPVTDDTDLIANWRDTSAYTGQRLTVTVTITGYSPGTFFVDVLSDQPEIIDFDSMVKYATPTGIEVVRPEVLSVAGLTGAITGPQLLDVLEPDLQAALEPPVDLSVLFENILA